MKFFCCGSCNERYRASSSNVSIQVQNAAIILYSKHQHNTIPRKYLWRLLIACIGVILAIAVRNVWVDTVCTLIWMIFTIQTIFECNHKIIKIALCFTFEVYYKVINMGIGILGLQIINNWYQRSQYSTIDNEMELPYSILVIIGDMLVVLLVSLTDGYNVPSKVKACFSLLCVCYFIYRLTQTWVFDLLSDDPNAKLIIKIGNNKYGIYWRSITISSLITSNIFLLKQIIKILLFPNRFAIINVHLPIKSKEQIIGTGRGDCDDANINININGNGNGNNYNNINYNIKNNNMKNTRIQNLNTSYSSDKKQPLLGQSVQNSLATHTEMSHFTSFVSSNATTNNTYTNVSNDTTGATIGTADNTYTYAFDATADIHIDKTQDTQVSQATRKTKAQSTTITTLTTTTTPTPVKAVAVTAAGTAGTATKSVEVTTMASRNGIMSSLLSNQTILTQPESDIDIDGDGLVSILSTGESGMDFVSEIEKQIEKYPICVYEDVTIWFKLLNKICRLNNEKCYKYSRIFSSNIIVFICLFISLFYVTIDIISLNKILSQDSNILGIVSFVSSIIWLISVIILSFNMNVNIFRYEMWHNFSIYWRLFDLWLAFGAQLIIDEKFNLNHFSLLSDKYNNSNNNNGSFNYAAVYLIILFKFISISITVISVSTVKAFILFSRLTQCFMITMVTVYWIHVGVSYSLSHNDVSIALDKDTSVSMKGIIFAKTLDAVIWFIYQLFEQLKYYDKLKLTNIKAVWIYRDPDA